MNNKFQSVAIVGRPNGAPLAEPLNALQRLLAGRGVRVHTDPNVAELLARKPDQVLPMETLIASADLAIAVGGDGTMLGVARVVARHGVPLVGINLGHLGFLTDISAEVAADALSDLLDGKFNEEQRILLEAEIIRDNKAIFRSVALNDVVVSRGAMGTMIEFAVEVNGEFVYSARADGLIIATPTGSTAYALSSGGPILQPGLPAISLVPISPHTLSNRPIAISSNSEVRVKLLRGLNARVNFDVQSYFDPATDDVVSVRAHPKPLRLLHPPSYSYFAMLRTKLHWNERTS